MNATAMVHNNPLQRQPTIFIWASDGSEDDAMLEDIRNSIMTICSSVPIIIVNTSNNPTGTYPHDGALTRISNSSGHYYLRSSDLSRILQDRSVLELSDMALIRTIANTCARALLLISVLPSRELVRISRENQFIVLAGGIAMSTIQGQRLQQRFVQQPDGV